MDFSKEVRTTFVIYRAEELPQGGDARLGQALGGLEAELPGQFVQVAAEGGNGLGEAGKAGIAADFADGAEDANCPELLQDIGITKEGGLQGLGLVVGLVLADEAQHRRD